MLYIVTVSRFLSPLFQALLLMDVRLGEVSGLEASAKIREIQAVAGVRTPIIAISSHSFDLENSSVREADLDGFIAKPIPSEILISTIQGVLH